MPPATTPARRRPAPGEHEEGEAKKARPPAHRHQIDNLVLNPAGSGGTRFLMFAAAFELKDAGALESMKVRDAELARRRFSRSAAAKTVEQLSDLVDARAAASRALADSLAHDVRRRRRSEGLLPTVRDSMSAVASETLSQNEIDGLLGGVGSGVPFAGRASRARRIARSQLYDFRRPHRVSKERSARSRRCTSAS